MEISKKSETTILTTQSIVVGDYVVSLQIKEVDGQIKYMTLSKNSAKCSIFTLNALVLDSMEEVVAAIELLRGIVKLTRKDG